MEFRLDAVVSAADQELQYPVNLRTRRREGQKIPHPVEERQYQYEEPEIRTRKLSEGDD